MDIKKRIASLKKLIKNKDANRIILKSDDPNFFWLFQEEIESAVVIICPKETIILTKSLEFVPKIFSNKSIKVLSIKKSEDIKNFFKKQKGVTLLNHEFITLRDKNSFNIKRSVDISSELEDLRSQKTDFEIKKIRIACNHVVKCWNLLTKKIDKELRSEMQIEKFIKKYALENNLDLAFSPVVASGKNAGTPHHRPSKKLNKGFLIIDFGFDFKGYKSDMTRTLYLGVPSVEEKKLYNELLEVQKKMIKKVKPGKSAKKLYEDTLKEMKYPDLFIHGLGHGVGVQIHEYPSIKQQSNHKIRKNQVLTIEPGYYSNRFGIRIEDTILVNKKPVILTNVSKKLNILR